MKCAWVQERLLLYLTEELSAADAARASDHLEECQECAAALKVLAASQESLREAIRTTVQPSASLDMRILQRIEALPRRRFLWPDRLSLWRPMNAFLLSGCALILVMLGYRWGQWDAVRSLAPGAPSAVSALPTLDLASLAEAHRTWNSRTESVDLDAGVVAARLTRQTGLNVPPLDLQDRAWRLKESGVVEMNHIPVALRHYDWNGIPVSLVQANGIRLDLPYSLRELKHHGRCFLIHQKEGLTYIFWCEGTDNFVLVARVPPPQLFALTCKLCATIRPG